MVRVPLFPADTSLLLDPAASGLPAVLAIFLVVAPAVCVGLLYRAEARLVAKPVAVFLMALRVTVVLVAAAVALLKPVVSAVGREAKSGRVVVAVDRSASLAVADPNRSPAAKLRLALGLKLARDLANDSTLTIALRSDSAGAVPDVVKRIDALTRADLARSALTDGADVLNRLSKRHRVDLIGFAGAVAELAPAALAAAPNGQATDLALPLRRAADATDDPVAVVLLTDGRHTAAGSPVTVAAELAQRGVPVYALDLTADATTTDAAVTAVRAPATVFRGSEIEVEAQVRLRGLPPGLVPVELVTSTGDPQLQTVAHPGGDKVHPVRFRVRGKEPGPMELTVRVPPVPGESHPQNNSRSATAIVAEDTAKVLVIDGEARWEYHYLSALLARDAGVRTTAVVFHQPRTGRMGDDEAQRFGYPSPRLPAGDSALEPFDAVVLGDVSPRDLPAEDRVRLERYVADYGGTLVVQAGTRFMPQAFANDEIFARLLPITGAKAVDPPAGAQLDLTPEGRAAAFMRMEATPDASERRWSLLPPHFWGCVGKAKPGAEVLARFANQPRDDGRNAALIARHGYGFGRVLYVGIDSTWRWRYKAGDVYHHRFWGQVVRWAASDKPLMAGNEQVRFGPRRAVVPAGQEVEVIVRYADTADPPKPGTLAAVRALTSANAQAALAALEPIDGKPHEFRARLRDLPSGQFSLELVAPNADGLGKAAVRVADADGAELSDLSGNIDLLRQLTAATGGKVVPVEQAGALADEVAAKSAMVEKRREIPLAKSFWTLLVFVGLIGTEWVVRKWAGLP